MSGQDRPVSEKPKGTGDAQKPRRFDRRSVAVFLGLLLLNYVIVSQLSGAADEPRVTIPYQPTFLEQVGGGNVGTITAKGATIDGTFEKAVRYPDAKATATTASRPRYPSSPTAPSSIDCCRRTASRWSRSRRRARRRGG